MSFIGLSRKDGNIWEENYVCLEKDDCELIRKAVEAIVEKKRKKLDYYLDIRDGGEMTSRQQTAMTKAENELYAAGGILFDINVYLKKAEQ